MPPPETDPEEYGVEKRAQETRHAEALAEDRSAGEKTEPARATSKTAGNLRRKATKKVKEKAKKEVKKVAKKVVKRIVVAIIEFIAANLEWILPILVAVIVIVIIIFFVMYVWATLCGNQNLLNSALRGLLKLFGSNICG